MCCRVLKIHRNKVYGSSWTEAGSGGIEIHFYKSHTIHEMVYYLKVDCDNLQIFTASFKAGPHTKEL